MRRIGMLLIEQRQTEATKEQAAAAAVFTNEKPTPVAPATAGRDILSVLVRSNLASVPSQTPESKFPVKQLTYELAPSPSRILRVDDFVLVKFLGAGGFGLVFLVFDKVTHRYFALKVIEKKRMYFTFFPKMFEEQRLGRMLVGSKWAARIEGSFDDSDNFYILMVRRNSLLNI